MNEISIGTSSHLFQPHAAHLAYNKFEV